MVGRRGDSKLVNCKSELTGPKGVGMALAIKI